MKQLTQAIFKNAPDWVKSAAVDENGMTYWYGCPSSDLFIVDDWWDWRPGHKSKYIGDKHVSDWQNSAIDREVTA